MFHHPGKSSFSNIDLAKNVIDRRSPLTERERVFVCSSFETAEDVQHFANHLEGSLGSDEILKQYRETALKHDSRSFRRGLLALQKTEEVGELRKLLGRADERVLLLAAKLPDDRRQLLLLDSEGFSVSVSKTTYYDTEGPALRFRGEKPLVHHFSRLIPSRRVLAADLTPFVEAGADLVRVVHNLAHYIDHPGVDQRFCRALREQNIGRGLLRSSNTEL